MWPSQTCISPDLGGLDNTTDWSLEIGQCYPNNFYKIPCGLGRRQSPQSVENLCKTIDHSLWISTAKSPLANHRSMSHRMLTEHDRKILQRMASKRRDEMNRQANSLVANHFWAVERNERDKLKRQHAAQIKDSVHARQAAEQTRVAERREALAAHESIKCMQERHQQMSKGRRSAQNFEQMQYLRRLSIARRAQLERERSNYAKHRRSEAEIGEALQVERCWTRMAHRLNRAERLRQQLSEDYRQRLLADNETQMLIHASKLEAARLVEDEQTEKLRQQIWERDQRCDDIARQKKWIVEDSRAQAQWTAELREELRRSVSPERFSNLHLY